MKLALIAVVGLLATSAYAAPCRDAHGKFIKCPPPAASTSTVHTTTTTVKSSTNHCRDAKGHFAKCGTPGTHPA